MVTVSFPVSPEGRAREYGVKIETDPIDMAVKVTFLEGGGPAGEDLEFSDFTTVNLRLFADLGAQPMAREHTWMRGARATLSIDNLFDERQEVRSSAGTTPISYQPDLMDPVGRTVRLTLRKLIF